MNTTQLVEALNARVVKTKELLESAAGLKENNVNIELFLFNNPEIGNALKSNVVADYVLQLTSKLIESRVHINVVKNVYDEYTLIFIMQMLAENNKATFNKLNRMLIDVISNSAKFDLYIKKRVNLSKVSSDDQIMETFWLIPLFVNVKALVDSDYNGFITGCKNISKNVSEFMGGYEFYVTNSNIKTIDTLAYKQYMAESMKLATTK